MGFIENIVRAVGRSFGSIAGTALGGLAGGPLGAFLGGTLGGTVIDKQPLGRSALTSLAGNLVGQGLRLGVGYLGNGITSAGARLGSNMLARAGISVASFASSPLLWRTVGTGLFSNSMEKIEAMLKPKLPEVPTLFDQMQNNFNQNYNLPSADPIFNRSIRMPTIEELMANVTNQTREAIWSDPDISLSNPRLTFDKIQIGEPRFRNVSNVLTDISPSKAFSDISDQKPRGSSSKKTGPTSGGVDVPSSAFKDISDKKPRGSSLKIEPTQGVVDIGSPALTNTTNKIRETISNGFIAGSHDIQPWERKNFTENIKKKQKRAKLQKFLKETFRYTGG